MIAVVGTGSIGRRHLANLRTLGREVVGVSEHRRAPSIDVDGTSVRCVPTLAAALAEEPDAVVVANPTSLHAACAAQVMAAGIDLYLEKPAALRASESAELEDLAQEAGVVVAIGQQLRFHPLLVRVAEVVASGSLGLLLSVEANLGEHLADYHPDEDYRQSYAARRELGGGVLLTQIHLIDFLVGALGPLRSVLALGGHRSNLEIDVEDSVSFLGTTAEATPVYAHLDYLQRPKRWEVAVAGTAGRLRADLHAGSLVVEGSDGSIRSEAHPVERNDLFLATMRDFLDAVEARRSPRCTLRDATEALAVVDAVQRSLASGAVEAVTGTGDARSGGAVHG